MYNKIILLLKSHNIDDGTLPKNEYGTFDIFSG